MKKIYLLAAVSVLTLGYAEVWAAQATGEGNISAKIVAPVTVMEAQRLDFGTILAPTGSSIEVTISATDGTRTATDASKLVGTNKGKAGLFNVTGAENQSMTINEPCSATLTGTGGSTMTVDTFATDPNDKLTLSGTSGQIKVGADLTVNADQAVGDYTGTYTITVSY